jgi:hypothetical protein
MDLECAATVSGLFDALTEYTPSDREVLRHRVVSVLTCAEQSADRCETWDTVLFLCGFLGSLVVMIATAINMAGFMTRASFEGLSTSILVLSSLATAGLGLRERLKLKDRAVLNRRTVTAIQRLAFLFLTKAGPYRDLAPDVRYMRFAEEIEDAKSAADKDHLKIRDLEDQVSTTGRVLEPSFTLSPPQPQPQTTPSQPQTPHVPVFSHVIA